MSYVPLAVAIMDGSEEAIFCPAEFRVPVGSLAALDASPSEEKLPAAMASGYILTKCGTFSI
jgi:hypothetical protein